MSDEESRGEADRIIAALGLKRHPEGGWYRQTWIGPVVGLGVGPEVGLAVGTAVGREVGPTVGREIGPGVGPAVGREVGPAVGSGLARATGTAILFLLKAGERSHWHRVDADEIWIFNAGAPLILSVGDEVATEFVLGPQVLQGQQVQVVVPRGWWQAARSTGDWTLVSCTVSPGFRFEGFELAEAGFDLAVDAVSTCGRR